MRGTPAVQLTYLTYLPHGLVQMALPGLSSQAQPDITHPPRRLAPVKLSPSGKPT